MLSEEIDKQILECKWLGVNKILREKYGFKGGEEYIKKEILEATKVFPTSDVVRIHLNYKRDKIELTFYHKYLTSKLFPLNKFSIDELVNLIITYIDLEVKMKY
jgi:hypothetical protein